MDTLFIGLGNGPALQGILQFEQLKLLTGNCQTIDDQHTK